MFPYAARRRNSCSATPWLPLLCLVFITTWHAAQANKQPLVIGSLLSLSMGSDQVDYYAWTAMHVAVMMINNDTSLLNGYELKIVYQDTYCERSICQEGSMLGSTAQNIQINSMNAFFWNITHTCSNVPQDKPVAIVGPGYSSEVMALKAAMQQIEKLTVSYSATSPALSNKTSYPYFARTCPSDATQGVLIAHIVKRYNFQACTAITCSDAYCQGLYTTFEATSMNLGIVAEEVRWTFGDLLSSERHLKSVLTNCSRSRVLLLLINDAQAKEIIQAAANLQIVDQFVWIGSEAVSTLDPKDLPSKFLGVSLQFEQESLPYLQLHKFWSGLDPKAFPGLEELAENPFVVLAYDTIYLLAHALQLLIDGGGDPYNSTALLHTLPSVQFQGATGPIALGQNLEPLEARYKIVTTTGAHDFLIVGSWSANNLTIYTLLSDLSVPVCAPTSILIGGLFQSWSDLHAAAAMVAIAQINADPSILPVTRLIFDIQNITMARSLPPENDLKSFFFDAILSKWKTEANSLSDPVNVVIGGGYSSDVAVLSPLLLQHNLLLFTPSATSPILSDKSAYPNVVRLCQVSTVEGHVIVDLVRFLGFQNVKIISCDDLNCAGFRDVVLTRAAEHGFRVAGDMILPSAQGSFQNDHNGQILIEDFAMQDCNVSVYIMCVHDYLALEIFDVFDTLGIKNKVVWITCEEVLSVQNSRLPNGILGTREFVPETQAFSRFLSYWQALNLSHFDPSYHNILVSGLKQLVSRGSHFSWMLDAADAVMLVARVFDTLIQKGGRVTEVPSIASEVPRTSFSGTSGEVRLDGSYDRLQSPYTIVNKQNNSWISIGVWNHSDFSLPAAAEGNEQVWKESVIRWPAGYFQQQPSICQPAKPRSYLLVYALVPPLALLGLVGIALLVYRYRKVQQDLAEISRVKAAMQELRKRLCITREEGFLLSNEKQSMFGLGRKPLRVLDHRYLEACAKFSLLQDFDVKHFDALSEILRYNFREELNPVHQSFLRRVPSTRKFSLSADHSISMPDLDDKFASPPCKQYFLLRDFVMNTCRKLLDPHRASASAGGSSLIKFDVTGHGDSEEEDKPSSTQLNVCPPSEKDIAEMFDRDFDSRFAFFIDKVLKVRIWQDDNMLMFFELKRMIQELLDFLAYFCDHRHNEMEQLPGGPQLLALKSEANVEDGSSRVLRQDDAKIQAIRVSDVDKKEYNFFKENQDLLSINNMIYEGIFVSQLFCRGQLLNRSFQRKVREIVFQHSISNLERISSVTCKGKSIRIVRKLECCFLSGAKVVEVHPAPVKTVGRMQEKLTKYMAPEYGTCWPYSARILDPVRTTLVCDGPQEILEVMRWFVDLKDATMKVVRVKNKFRRDYISDGYRDLTVCVLFLDESGLSIVGEIQLHDKKIHALKMKMHKLYKIKRAQSPDLQ